MSNEINVVARKKESRLELIRANSALPVAQIRDVPVCETANKELIKLVQRLFLSGPNAVNAVVFSAVEPGAGCTFICTKTAEILANRLDEPVCLVDANFRSPGFEKHFEITSEGDPSPEEEWTFMPVSSDLRKALSSRMWLVSYRPVRTDCPRLASIERFESFIADLRRDFRYVIIDAPCLNEYVDAALFAKTADGVVMVLEANKTRREAALKAKDMLDANGVPVLGTVLNKRTFPIPDVLYRRL